uniref:RWD domain-containing protein n=1 Tax=Lutzomyia longipalpis TaxID=7200 RepID=A0A1B0CKR5_LUTLO
MDVRNYKEDQANEIEALDSIYCGELEILATEPYHRFKLPIATEEYNADTQENGLRCDLIFTYTEKYPDTAPLVEIEDPINFLDDYEKRLVEHIEETVAEHLGMEMIFSLVSSAQEWLNQRWDDVKQEEELQRERRLREEEELEQKKFEGTRVTVEAFLAWKATFEDEVGITQRRLKDSGENRKLTGRELFLRDTTLNESDIKFLLEAGDSIESVKIDESLFQNIDDLELDSDTDDEDYEDQANEIEALDSIYCGELEILATEPYHRFKLPIATEEYNADTQENGLRCDLIFTYTEKYPDTAPLVEIEDPINFLDDYEKRLVEHIEETVAEHLGMEMIFSLVSSAQEWLNQRWDDVKQEEELQRERRLREEEELEQKKFEGTRVTVEAFLAWKSTFEDEVGITQRRLKDSGENRKLTGRELFLRDTTLNESDIKFLLEAGDSIESVKIDESLFQNIDDLELDSDTDDEDYVPGKE